LFATTLDKDFFIKTDTGITHAVSSGIFYSADDLPNRVVYHTFTSPVQAALPA